MLNEEIKTSINDSVLCWLATVDANGMPNVSPKEVFLADGDKHLLIANIASPSSITNIQKNALVCVSFIDVFKQKGFKLNGKAVNLTEVNSEYDDKLQAVSMLTEGKFPVKSIIRVEVTQATPIIAPKYWLFSGITEEKQIESAMQLYGVQPLDYEF